jgi:hypothetical protein
MVAPRHPSARPGAARCKAAKGWSRARAHPCGGKHGWTRNQCTWWTEVMTKLEIREIPSLSGLNRNFYSLRHTQAPTSGTGWENLDRLLRAQSCVQDPSRVARIGNKGPGSIATVKIHPGTRPDVDNIVASARNIAHPRIIAGHTRILNRTSACRTPQRLNRCSLSRRRSSRWEGAEQCQSEQGNQREAQPAPG